jgi:ubiquinone/menaquinone biosynthesis C-methylase UbiE
MTASFYDELAPYFHLLYSDWENSVRIQGVALAALLEKCGVMPGDPVHDAACGIGTQTLGLVRQGYKVTASDISPGALARLRAELSKDELKASVFLTIYGRSIMSCLTPWPR